MNEEPLYRSDCSVELIDFMGGDNSVAMSAWVSFGNDNEERLQDRDRVEGLINFLYKNGHHTPFESSVFTFRITTPIFVAREYQRHRAQSLNEWSLRYSKLVPEFYLPAHDRPLVQEGKPGKYYFTAGTLDQHAKVLQRQRRVYEEAWNTYQDLIDAGVAKEVARNTLPVGTYTYFYSTMNARNLMHFLTLRSDSTALHEIQQVAEGMSLYFEDKMPLTHAAWKEYHG